MESWHYTAVRISVLKVRNPPISAVRLSRLEGQLRGQKTSQEEFRLFAHGMVILFAIDVLEGRETLNIN